MAARSASTPATPAQRAATQTAVLQARSAGTIPLCAPARAEPVARVEDRLARSGKSRIDMTRPARLVSSEDKYSCAIFTVVDKRYALSTKDGGEVVIDRNLIDHAHGAIALVHDESLGGNGVPRDRYLVEREYRVGPNGFVFGLSAGLVEPGEDPMDAAFREVREESGVVVDRSDPDAVTVDYYGDFYSSGGMTNECASLYVLHLKKWEQGPVDFDPDEFVESAWVNWDELTSIPIRNASSSLLIAKETIRRLRAA